jgi:hypothetical protein
MRLIPLIILLAAPLACGAAELTQADVGNPALTGSSSEAPDGTTMVAGGKDVWGASDQFRYAYQTVTGDFDARVRVQSLQPTQLYTRIGLMAREDLTKSSRHVYFIVFSSTAPRHNNNGGYEYQFRDVAGGKSGGVYPVITPGAPPQFPVTYPNAWLRLVRQGNTFTCYASTDGKTWNKYGEHVSTLPAQVYLGVALTAHNATATTTAKFSDFSVTTPGKG